MTRWLLAIFLIIYSGAVWGQSAPQNPPMDYGMVPTVGQWIGWFQQKEDVFGTQPGLPLIGNSSGGVTAGAKSGATNIFATSTGALTSGHCVSIDGSGNLIDAGGACTIGGGGGTVSAGSAGDLGYYASSGTVIAPLTLGSGVQTLLGGTSTGTVGLVGSNSPTITGTLTAAATN